MAISFGKLPSYKKNNPDIQLSTKHPKFSFYCDIFIQAISALLFFLAFWAFFKKRNAWPLINIAFGISMALWAIFLIMEEFFIAYSYEGTHIRLLSLELISLCLFHLLHDQKIFD